VRLKTDSRFLHEYTRAVVEANGLELLACTTDLYGGGGGPVEPEVREVHTFYENMFLEQGVPITYMAFRIDHQGPYVHPSEKYDSARWRELDSSRRSFGHQG
jgi:tRNA (guanine-N7-)-methyltransferase